MSDRARSAQSLPAAAPHEDEVSVPVLLRNAPAGFDWGFYSSEEPRMHVQTLRGTKRSHKVWLERRGRWSIEADTRAPIPSPVFHAVNEALNDPDTADHIRMEWVHQMIAKDWLKVRVTGTRATITAYPNTQHAFVREVDLSRHARPSLYSEPDKDVGFDAGTATLVIGKTRNENEWVMIKLADLLWER